jgi:hypothetical protein
VTSRDVHLTISVGPANFPCSKIRSARLEHERFDNFDGAQVSLEPCADGMFRLSLKASI